MPKHSLLLLSSATLLVGAMIGPSHAGSGLGGSLSGTVGGVVGGVTGTVGGATKGVTSTVGGVTKSVTTTVGGITGTSGGGGVTGTLGTATGTVGGVIGSVTGGGGLRSSKSGGGGHSGNGGNSGSSGFGVIGSGLGGLGNGTGVNIGLLGPKGVVGGTVKSNLIGGINGRLTVLSRHDLVKLCLSIGGGSGCNSPDRTRVSNVVHARLAALSKAKLASLCVTVGGRGCGDPRGDGVVTKVGVLGPKGVVSGSVKSKLVGGINGKLTVLSKNDLLRLCLNVGGGSGCNNGDRSHLIGLIQARLGLLSNTSLASLCLNIGSTGCGGSANIPGGGPSTGGGSKGGGNGGGGATGGGTVSGGGSGGNGGGGHGVVVDGGKDPRVVRVSTNFRSMSPSEQRALKLRCGSILISPAAFDDNLVRLCQMIRQF